MTDSRRPSGWAVSTVGELGTWYSGGTPSKSRPDYWDGLIPWVSPKDMKTPRIADAIDHVSEKTIGMGTRLVPENTILIVVRGMILAHSFPVALTERPVAFNQDMKALIPNPGCHSAYLLYWLQNQKTRVLEIVSEATHGTKRLPTDALHSLEIGIPPLPEQKKIAAILGSVDEVIAATQAVIDQTRKVKQGLLAQLLTRGIGHTRFKKTEIGKMPEEWGVEKLADIVAFDRPITYGIVQTGSLVLGGVPCVRVVDLVKRRMCIRDMITTTPEISTSYRRTILRDKDIMFALRGEIGHVVLAEESQVGINLTRGVALISAGEKVVPEYLLWAIRCPSVRSDIRLRVTGSALREISLKELRQVKVPLPPKSEQEKIAKELNKRESNIDIEQDVLESMSLMKRGLMQDLLSGRVRVKGAA